MKLSILICSLDSRKELRADLIKLLRNTIGEHTHEAIDDKEYLLDKYIGKEAEILICTDNRVMSVGKKRNLLIRNASGDYTVFIDDDDMVTVAYVGNILEATKYNTDVIVFDAIRYHNGALDRQVIYGTEFKKDYSTRTAHFRIPNHLMPVKRSITSRVMFPDVSFGEDSEWARKLLPNLKTQQRIKECMYEYWYDDKITQTQGNARR